jgi:hypothetical protein
MERCGGGDVMEEGRRRAFLVLFFCFFEPLDRGLLGTRDPILLCVFPTIFDRYIFIYISM